MKILIVDDHALVRRGLHYVVKEGFPDAEVTEAESAAAALEHIHNGKEIDLALVDVRMPDLDGLELLRALKTDRPDMPVVMLSTYDNAPYVKRALADGASGYLLKDATPEDLSQAINVALSGSGNVLSPRVIQNLFEEHESAGRDQQRTPRRVQPHAARARHPRAPRRGAGQPRDRGTPLPVGEDRQGAPRRDLPQARRDQPDTGRDDGRPDGCRPDPGGARPRVAGPALPVRRGSLRRTDSPWALAGPGTCCPRPRRGSRPPWSIGRTRSVRSSSPGRG